MSNWSRMRCRRARAWVRCSSNTTSCSRAACSISGTSMRSSRADVIRSLAFYLVFYGGTVLYVLAFWLAARLGDRPARAVVRGWAKFHLRCARWLLGIRLVVQGEMPNEGVLVAMK